MITLLKHELLRTYDRLGLLAAIAALVALAGALLAATGWPVIAQVGLAACMVAVIGLVPAAQLMLVVAYWRSGYGRTGYLTQTLPVRGSRIYWAKLLWAWLVSLVGILLSVGLLLALAPLAARSAGADPASIITTLREGWATLYQVAGAWGLVAAITAILLSILVWPTHYFFAVSIGSQAPLNRMGFGGPVLVWLGVYLASQVLVFGSFAAIPLAVGMDGDRLGLVRFDLFAEMMAGSSADVMPIGFIPALVAVSVACIVWSARSWNRRVSLV